MLCASSVEVESEELSQPQSKQSHIYTIKTSIKSAFMFMRLNLLIRLHIDVQEVKPRSLNITVELILLKPLIKTYSSVFMAVKTHKLRL